MGRSDQLSRGALAARLARGAADWLIDGPGVDLGDPCLYHGLADVVIALHEAYQHFGDDRYRRAVARSTDALRAQVDILEGLLMGNAGIGLGALHAGDLDLA